MSGWPACKYLLESDGRRYYASLNQQALSIKARAMAKSASIARLTAYATDIEGLEACQATWCKINYQVAQGWVRHEYLASWSF